LFINFTGIFNIQLSCGPVEEPTFCPLRNIVS